MGQEYSKRPTEEKKPKKKFEPVVQNTGGIRNRVRNGPEAASKLPKIEPVVNCYLKLLKLERVKDYLMMEEELIKRLQLNKPQEEKEDKEMLIVETMRGTPMEVGELQEIINENHAIVENSLGNHLYVPIMSFVDRTYLEPRCLVLLNKKFHHVVGVLNENIDNTLDKMKLSKAPTVSYSDLGGLELQIQEIREAVELPLTHPEYYEEMGIKPPRGVILYGPPGTGKTLLAKCVANQTSATFLRLVGSELIQKYSGDGPRLVRQLFQEAETYAPSIIFIDEIDAVGTKRRNATCGGEREVQRTMLELLNQLDGFDSLKEVKVIMATNRIEDLDPALIRPGRIDRKIEFPMPNDQSRLRIFEIHSSKMTLCEDVNFKELLATKDNLSGADIKAICSEAAMYALRDRRLKITMDDFVNAQKSVVFKKKEGIPEELYS